MIILVLNDSNSNSETKTYNIMADGILVGMCQLRSTPRQSEVMPEGFESHVYFEIKPSYRGKGYANDALRALIQEARKDGFKELFITASEENIPSQKVIEKNGGELIKTSPNKDQKVYRKYIIEI